MSSQQNSYFYKCLSSAYKTFINSSTISKFQLFHRRKAFENLTASLIVFLSIFHTIKLFKTIISFLSINTRIHCILFFSSYQNLHNKGSFKKHKIGSIQIQHMTLEQKHSLVKNNNHPHKKGAGHSKVTITNQGALHYSSISSSKVKMASFEV